MNVAAVLVLAVFVVQSFGARPLRAQEAEGAPTITIVAIVSDAPVAGEEVDGRYEISTDVPITQVSVSSSLCGSLPAVPKRGDTDPDGFVGVLDVGEVWVYECTAVFDQRTDFVSVIANDLLGTTLPPVSGSVQLDYIAPPTSPPSDTTARAVSSEEANVDTSPTSPGTDGPERLYLLAVVGIALLVVLVVVAWLLRRQQLMPPSEDRLYVR